MIFLLVFFVGCNNLSENSNVANTDSIVVDNNNYSKTIVNGYSLEQMGLNFNKDNTIGIVDPNSNNTED